MQQRQLLTAIWSGQSQEEERNTAQRDKGKSILKNKLQPTGKSSKTQKPSKKTNLEIQVNEIA